MFNNKITQCIQQRIGQHAQGTDAYSFFNLLTSSELLDTVESLLPEHRERLFPPTETLSMFLAQAMNSDRSCQKAVNDAAIKRLVYGMNPHSTATGAYCRARKRLPIEMVSTLTQQVGQLIDQRVPDDWRWRGRRVRLIDGTSVSMPDTAANQLAFPQQGAQKPGLGFPICRIVGVMCLSSGAVLNAAIGRFNGKGASEHNLLRTLLSTFEPDDVVLGDAFYGSFTLLTSLQKLNVDGVFEQMGPRKKKTDFRKGVRLGANDHLIEIPKPKVMPNWMSQEAFERLPDSLTVRELKVGGKVLITTLLDPKDTPRAALNMLYKQRWHVELDLRNLKTTLGMETFSCKTPAMVEKEMWIYFLAYNLIRLLMAQAALWADLQPRQLSFKHSLQIGVAWMSRGISEHNQESDAALFILMAQRVVGNRPGRQEPRAVKRRPKPLPLLVKPRQQARQQIAKDGHPGKLK